MNHKYILMDTYKDFTQIIRGTVPNKESDNVLDNNNIRIGREEWDIMQLLSMLPKKKASADFDRKMAAAFSLELEKEIQQKNAAKNCEKI